MAWQFISSNVNEYFYFIILRTTRLDLLILLRSFKSGARERSKKSAHRDHVPSQTIPIPLNLADRRGLPPVDSLLPVTLHLRGRLVLVLVIVGSRLLPLTDLLLGDLRHGGRGGRCRDRLPLNRALLSLYLMLAPLLLLLLRLPDLLLGPLLLLKGLDLRRSTRFQNNCDRVNYRAADSSLIFLRHWDFAKFTGRTNRRIEESFRIKLLNFINPFSLSNLANLPLIDEENYSKKITFRKNGKVKRLVL